MTFQQFLDDLVGRPTYSAAAIAIAVGDRLVVDLSAGDRDPSRGDRLPPGPDDLFDLASITKPCVATLALVLAGRGDLPLDLPLREVWGEGRLPDTARDVTLEDLLRHRSGLRAWAPMYGGSSDTPLTAETWLEPRWWTSRRPVYSDLGYQLWGRAAEVVLGASLGELWSRYLGAWAESELVVAPAPASRSIRCEMGTGKEIELAAELGLEAPRLGPPALGRTQDGNARFLGGLAGHAGLFGTARGVLRLAREWCSPGALLGAEPVGDALAGDGRLRLGWRRGEPGDAERPRARPRSGWYHPGFTGGIVWFEPTTRTVAVLLGHRRDPAVDVDPLRAEFVRRVREGSFPV